MKKRERSVVIGSLDEKEEDIRKTYSTIDSLSKRAREQEADRDSYLEATWRETYALAKIDSSHSRLCYDLSEIGKLIDDGQCHLDDFYIFRPKDVTLYYKGYTIFCYIYDWLEKDNNRTACYVVYHIDTDSIECKPLCRKNLQNDKKSSQMLVVETYFQK